MRHPVSEKLKQIVRPSLYRVVHRRKPSYQCPICGYHGPFKDKHLTQQLGTVRCDSKCPGCNGTERHRMLSLVCDEVFSRWIPAGKRLLHFAPEACLTDRLKADFAVYHTTDLFMPRVDFKEDIQNLSFPSSSYDCALISHVMTSIPDMAVAVKELRRILAPGGILIIAESFVREETIEFAEQRGDFWREVGLDAVDLLEKHFDHVDLMMSDRYDQNHQLDNRMQVHGKPDDGFPTSIRIDGVGYKTVVAICHTQRDGFSANCA